MYWSSWDKKYAKYETSKPAFIHNFDDQLVYLANYILKNRYKNNKVYSCDDWNIGQIKENSDFKYKAKWEGDTVTIPRDEYNELKRANPLARVQDKVEVFINGHRYNLS